MDEIIEMAHKFASYKHREQKRKYTGEPYFNHCEEVAKLVASVCKDPDVIAAAYLHDTIEDTDTTADEIKGCFNLRVAKLVLEVTDVSKPEHGNRAKRKEMDRQHIALASDDGQLIKLADLISNTKSIVERDPVFAIKYLEEKRLLLEVINSALPLYEQAKSQIGEPQND